MCLKKWVIVLYAIGCLQTFSMDTSPPEAAYAPLFLSSTNFYSLSLTCKKFNKLFNTYVHTLTLGDHDIYDPQYNPRAKYFFDPNFHICGLQILQIHSSKNIEYPFSLPATLKYLHINLTNNPNQRPIIQNLQDLTNLTDLKISRCYTTDNDLKPLTNLRRLCLMDFSNSKLSPVAFQNLTNLETLELVSLSKTQISSETFLHLRNLKNLHIQDTYCCYGGYSLIPDVRLCLDYKTLNQLTGLKSLNLIAPINVNCQYSSLPFPNSLLLNLPNLTELSCGSNFINIAPPPSFKMLKVLEISGTIDLRHRNNFLDAVLTLDNLQHLKGQEWDLRLTEIKNKPNILKIIKKLWPLHLKIIGTHYLPAKTLKNKTFTYIPHDYFCHVNQDRKEILFRTLDEEFQSFIMKLTLFWTTGISLVLFCSFIM